MNLEKVIADLQETAKVLDGKVVIEASVLDELRKSDEETKATVASLNQKVEELEKTNAAAIEKSQTLECESVVASSKAYVANKEKEIAEAEAAHAAEIAKRKEELKSKGFETEEIIAHATSISSEDYTKFLATLEIAAEVGKKQSTEDLKKQILKDQKDFASAGETGTSNELNLGTELSTKERLSKIVSKAVQNAKNNKK